MKTKKTIFGIFSIILFFLAVIPFVAADNNVDVALQWMVNGQGMGANKILPIDVDETVSCQVAVNSVEKYSLKVTLLDENEEKISTLLDLPDLMPADGNPDFEKILNYVPENDDTIYYIHAIAFTPTGHSDEEQLQLNVAEEAEVCLSGDDDDDGVCNDVDLCLSDVDPGNFDKDDDGVGDVCDNCFEKFNPNQEDNYGSGNFGDACEDSDGDGSNDADDNCPLTQNPGQADADNDGIGDACDKDADNDGVEDDADNCVNVPNSNQGDYDGDGIGDSCDSDLDGDGINNGSDDCPLEAEDFDGFEDEDGCPEKGQPCTDSDNDGVCDFVDNCINVPNPGQGDLDNDGVGNLCDLDIDGDGMGNNHDDCPFEAEDFDGFEDEDGCPDGVNKVPHLLVTGDNQINEMETLSLDINVNDEKKINLEVKMKECLLSIPIPFTNGICLMSSYEDVPEGISLSGMYKDNVDNKFILTWTPDYSYVKHPLNSITKTLVFIADDGNLEATKEFKVTIDDVNQKPLLFKHGETEVDEGETFSLDFSLSDLDEEDELSFELLPENEAWELVKDDENDIYYLTWETTCNDAGEYPLTALVSDNIDVLGEDLSLTVTEACEVPCLDSDNDGVCDEDDLCPDEAGTVENEGCPLSVNHPPIFGDVEDQEVVEGEYLEFNIVVNDPEDDEITVELLSESTPNAVIDLHPTEENTFLFRWDTEVGDAGEYNINVQATDSNDNSAIKEVKVIVLSLPCLDSDADGICDDIDVCPLEAEDFDGNEDEDGCPEEEPVNHAPIVLSNPITAATENVQYTYQFKAIDPDGDVIAFTLVGAPEGMTMDDKGLVQWTPESGNTQAKVVIAVTDGEFIVKQGYTIGIKSDYKNVKLASVQLAMEEVMVGDYLSAQVKVVNNGNKNMDDLKISMIVPELGLKKSVSEFDLKPGQNKNKNLNLQIPYYAQPGEYLVKVSVTNSGFHEQTYRLLTIY